MKLPFKLFFIVNVVLFSLVGKAQTDTPIFKNNAYAIFKDGVIQGAYKAKAVSSTELTSNYQSPVNQFQSPEIAFKFSINGKDNEMMPGKDHLIHASSGKGAEFTTPVIKFGQQYIDKTEVLANTYLKPDTKIRIRLDMREVLEAFKHNGFYTTFNGDKIYKDDFKGVYVAGNTSPLIWDFDNLMNYPGLQLKDPDGDGIYEVTLTLNQQKEQKLTASSWKLSRDISAFPQYQSSYPLIDALYNLALEEMENSVEPDSTLRTGKEWAGVWTRDISYSIILSMAILQPRVAEYSLMRKVKNDRLIQDTGTGGSYPVSSDRMIWAVAAWEVYKTTGDKEWLKRAYRIIKNSVADDIKNNYDPKTGLVKGESSFLDWRDQTYPKWMQPADIYESECLGTNAVHYQTNVVLAEMAKLLNEPNEAVKYSRLAETIKLGINQYLWVPEKGYYGQFLYGRNFKIRSPRSEALGEALSVIFNIADANRKQQIVARTPVSNFGVPCIYPQIPNIPPYHNNAVWPFVQSYWSLAAAKAGNEAALLQSMSAIYRPAALFLTNKENFVAENGDFAGTQINSSNMLWSLSGNIAMVYKVLLGIEFHADKISFKPFVPQALVGKQILSNFKYRNAVLDIEMEGFGNKIQSITMDGKPLGKAEIPASLTGRHQLKIVLANELVKAGKVNLVKEYISPATPFVSYSNGELAWNRVEGAVNYQVIKNGQSVSTTKTLKTLVDKKEYGEYQVIAIDQEGMESFASEPVQIIPDKALKIMEMETIAPKASLPYKGFSGDGFIEISKEKNTSINIKVEIPETGTYAIDFKYANGNGPTNTENKCALRTLKMDELFLGTVVFPQRGRDEWSNWGFSNAVQVSLEKGSHMLSLLLESENENMNGTVNQAMLDYVRVIKRGRE